jgi:hypothetical protein
MSWFQPVNGLMVMMFHILRLVSRNAAWSAVSGLEAGMRTSRNAACMSTLLLISLGCGSDEKKYPEIDANFDNPGAVAGKGTLDAGKGLQPGECANGLVTTSRVTPRVVLVLDGSCSMSTNYPANGAASSTECTTNENGRWSALRRALIDPQRGVVARLQGVVEFGVAVFGTAVKCPIPGSPVEPGLNNLTRIAQRVPSVQPGMYTPTGPALDWVYDNLITQSGGPDDRSGPQIVILATDGEPNSCGGGGGGGGGGRGNQGGGGGATTNYQPSIDAVRKGTNKGATTYVISLADAAGPFHDHLQELANLGNPSANGRAQLYEPSSPEQLEANLQSLVSAAVGCELQLNGAVDTMQACSGSVKLQGTPLECNSPNGWTLIDERHIRIQGTACDKLTNAPETLVEASFDCTVFRPD